MTDADLQLAIDKTMAMAMSTIGGYQHDKFRELAKEHLSALYKVQAMRAMQLHAPGVRPGAIVEMSKAVCGKCGADRLKEPCKKPSNCMFMGVAQ